MGKATIAEEVTKELYGPKEDNLNTNNSPGKNKQLTMKELKIGMKIRNYYFNHLFTHLDRVMSIDMISKDYNLMPLL